MIASESTPAPPAAFACGEMKGGNGTIHAQVALPGLRGVLYSRPCAGASGGDIHYLSECGSGPLARVCLADVAGHGSAVAAVGAEMHAHLRRSVDVIATRRLTLTGSRLCFNRETGSCEDLARLLLAALHGHAASDELAHDDATFLLAEFVEGPPGPALWHVFKHRLLRQERR